MGELKATPGPWVALAIKTRLTGMASQPLFDDGRWVIFPKDDTERLPLAEVDHGDDQYEPARKQAEHDAHLIAAAPELYEALEDMLAESFGAEKSCGHDFTCICPEEKARAALAKARGEIDAD